MSSSSSWSEPDGRRGTCKNVLGELARNGGFGMVYEPGTRPSEEWQKKISEYAFRDLEGGRYSDLTEWGVDEETGDRLYDEYYSRHFDSKGGGSRILVTEPSGT